MLSGAEGPVDTSKAPTHPDVGGKVGVVAASRTIGGHALGPWCDANQREARRQVFACWLTRRISRQYDPERWLMTFDGQPSARLDSSTASRQPQGGNVC